MREPGTGLADVEPERLEPLVQTDCQRRGPPLLVVEDEHADAAGLAVAAHPEHDRARDARRGRTESPADSLDVARGAVSEEREREVQALGRDDPAAVQLGVLPGDERGDRLGGSRRAQKRRSRSSPATLAGKS